MVKGMLDFSGPLELDKSKECVEEIVEECLMIVADIARERNVKIETRFSNALPRVNLDTVRMKQVLLNLVMNAIQASPEEEVVTVCTSRKRKNIIIDVTDCGCGIPRNKREEIFRPFFTTKQGGNGLGLSVAKKIVEAHKGHITISDNSQRGVTFRLVLPTGRVASQSEGKDCQTTVPVE
jgi:signal transduction histidine kinase